MKHAALKSAVLVLLLLPSIEGCKSSSNGNTPSGPPAVASDLLGTWLGVDSPHMANVGDPIAAMTVVLTGSQLNGDTVTGASTISFGQPPTNINPANGTMSLNVAGTTVTVSITIPPGAWGKNNNFPQCSMTGTGTGTASATQISVALTTTFDPTCANGALYGAPATVFTGNVLLNKQ